VIPSHTTGCHCSHIDADPPRMADRYRCWDIGCRAQMCAPIS
jgi:hypothetical protein